MVGSCNAIAAADCTAAWVRISSTDGSEANVGIEGGSASDDAEAATLGLPTAATGAALDVEETDSMELPDTSTGVAGAASEALVERVIAA